METATPETSATIDLFVFGCGGVGSVLLDQLNAKVANLQDESGVILRVIAICRSKTMTLSDSGIDLMEWRSLNWLEKNDNILADLMKTSLLSGAETVAVDATSSEETTEKYVGWLTEGIHVVTANKKANSGPQQTYTALHEARKSSGSIFQYETNVGAGLPIIKIIQDLRFTGDEILEIEGVFSGTLSYIFNDLCDTDCATPPPAFSSVVETAAKNGYTEPDPREDLSGLDVARKVVILARESGLNVDLDAIPVKSLVPEPLQDSAVVSIPSFLSQLPNYDAGFVSLVANARERGEVLRYVGRVDVISKTCSVELKSYPASHPFGGLQGSDNSISIRTDRYDHQPLVISGPGAGNDVTAAGLFADLRTVAYRLKRAV